MKKTLIVLLAGMFALILTSATFAATKVIGEFQIYWASASPEGGSSVIISMPIGKLTPSMGMAMVDDIKDTFNLHKIVNIANPNLVASIGESTKISYFLSYVKGLENKKLTLMLNPVSINKQIAHVKVSLGIEGMNNSDIEFFAPFGKVVTLAERLDHHYIFVLCSFKQGSIKSCVRLNIVKKVPPIYPVSMREQGKEGIVVLEVKIGTDGTVSNVKVIKSPDEAFSKASVDAVKKWVWSTKGINKSLKTTLTIKFSLDSKQKKK